MGDLHITIPDGLRLELEREILRVHEWGGKQTLSGLITLGLTEWLEWRKTQAQAPRFLAPSQLPYVLKMAVPTEQEIAELGAEIDRLLTRRSK